MRVFIFLAAAFLALSAVSANEKKIVCYFGQWSVYRQGHGKFNIENVDPNLCTHLIYAFVGLNGKEVKILDPWADLPDDGAKDGFRKFNDLRKVNPKVKTMVAIGGWNESSPRFSKMVANQASRKEFIQSVIAFLKKYKFDGFDLDWEYPAQRDGSNPKDVENFSALIKELKAAFASYGYLLSAAVGATENSASKSYKIKEISKHLDFINLMTYDLHTGGEPKTGMHSGLYGSPASDKLSVDSAVKYWLSEGCPPEKLIVGIPMYGRSWTLAKSTSNGVGSQAAGTGRPGSYTKEDGYLAYYEICEKIAKKELTVKYDGTRKVPYAFGNNQWVGFENVESVKEKAEYILKNQLGGAMIWVIDNDDFAGICGKKYPLLGALNAVLHGENVVSEEMTTVVVTENNEEENSGSSQTQEGEELEAGRQLENTEESDDAKELNGVGEESQECTNEGYFLNPTTCGYTVCVAIGKEFIKYNMACPAGLCFDPDTQVCNYRK